MSKYVLTEPIFFATYHNAFMYLFRLWQILIGRYQSTHTEEISVPRVTVRPNSNIALHREDIYIRAQDIDVKCVEAIVLNDRKYC